MRLARPVRRAKTAWLSGSYVPERHIREDESDWIPLKNVGLGPAYNVEGSLYWTGGAGGAARP